MGFTICVSASLGGQRGDPYTFGLTLMRTAVETAACHRALREAQAGSSEKHKQSYDSGSYTIFRFTYTIRLSKLHLQLKQNFIRIYAQPMVHGYARPFTRVL